jgi:hypothetical protein
VYFFIVYSGWDFDNDVDKFIYPDQDIHEYLIDHLANVINLADFWAVCQYFTTSPDMIN